MAFPRTLGISLRKGISYLPVKKEGRRHGFPAFLCCIGKKFQKFKFQIPKFTEDYVLYNKRLNSNSPNCRKSGFEPNSNGQIPNSNGQNPNSKIHRYYVFHKKCLRSNSLNCRNAGFGIWDFKIWNFLIWNLEFPNAHNPPHGNGWPCGRAGN